MTGVQTCALPICFPVTIRGGAYFFAETHTAGDGGCPVLATLATNGGGSQAAGDIGYIYAGDGGNGGRGGRAFYDDPRHNPMYWEYCGGDRANPSSVVHGKKGGNAILINHAIIILNAGIISVGGGGGGASGGAVAGNDAGCG